MSTPSNVSPPPRTELGNRIVGLHQIVKDLSIQGQYLRNRTSNLGEAILSLPTEEATTSFNYSYKTSQIYTTFYIGLKKMAKEELGQSIKQYIKKGGRLRELGEMMTGSSLDPYITGIEKNWQPPIEVPNPPPTPRTDLKNHIIQLMKIENSIRSSVGDLGCRVHSLIQKDQNQPTEETRNNLDFANNTFLAAADLSRECTPPLQAELRNCFTLYKTKGGTLEALSQAPTAIKT